MAALFWYINKWGYVKLNSLWIKLSKEAIIGYVVLYVGIVPPESWIELVGIILEGKVYNASKVKAWFVSRFMIPLFPIWVCNVSKAMAWLV